MGHTPNRQNKQRPVPATYFENDKNRGYRMWLTVQLINTNIAQPLCTDYSVGIIGTDSNIDGLQIFIVHFPRWGDMIDMVR